MLPSNIRLMTIKLKITCFLTINQQRKVCALSQSYSNYTWLGACRYAPGFRNFKLSRCRTDLNIRKIPVVVRLMECPLFFISLKYLLDNVSD